MSACAISTPEKRPVKKHPKQYDGVVDKKTTQRCLQEEVYNWDGQEAIVYSAVVNAVNMNRNVKIVIIDVEDPDKKTQTRKVFFSRDCSMSAKDVIDIYRSLFQVEFLFRDTKQFTGLCHCQARDKRALDFAFNLSLAAINVANAFCRQYNLNLSIADLKLLMHNVMMIERLLSMFGKIPNLCKNQKEHYFKDLLLYGLKAAD